MSTALERIRRTVPGLWAGVLLCVALMATPSAFATLDKVGAAQLVARLFVQEAWLSLVLAMWLLMLERQRAKLAFEAGEGSVLSTEMLWVLGTMFCTVLGYFVIQPLMPAARAGQGPWTFGQLHLASTACFGLKILLVLGLVWRASRLPLTSSASAEGQINPAGPSSSR